MDQRDPRMAWTDEPITSSEDDQLGFSLFAEQLASEAVGWTKSPKVVAALTGPWGSGKTSIVNLAAPCMESAGVTLLHFQPWLFSNHVDLAGAFLAFLARAIGADRPNFTEILNDFGEYADRMGAEVATAFGVRPAYEGGRKVAGIWQRVTRSRAAPPTASTDLIRFKDRVEVHLRSAGGPFVVVLDDIDRLTPAEMVAVFQLVKATADFPNVAYLLIYDEVAVEQALKHQGIDARAYLEKIVQVNLHAPRPNQTVLTDMIVRAIEPVIGPLPADSWDSARWEQVLYRSRPLFRNVRDIRRFANSLGFHLRLLRGEVDPVDLIALESLRMFAPKAHRRLGESKEYFVSDAGGYDKEDSRNARDRVIQDVPEPVRPAMERLLEYLFPVLDKYGMHGAGDAARRRRACHEAYFDRYWEFAPGPGEVPDDEIKGLRDRSVDEIERKLIEYVESDRISYVLDRLPFLAESLPTKHPLIYAVLRIFPRLDASKTFFTGGSDDPRMLRVVRASLPEEPSARKAAFEALLLEAPSVGGLVYVFALEEEFRQRASEGHSEGAHLDEASFRELVPALADLIRCAAENGALSGDPRYFMILHYWKAWSSPEEVRATVETDTADDAKLVAYVTRGIRTGVRLTDSGNPRIHRLAVDSVSEFLDVDNARQRLRDVRESGSLTLSVREQVAIDMFLEGREEATEDEESRLAQA